MDDPIDLDAQDRAKEANDEIERVKRLIEIEDFKWLMAHKQGRRFIWRLLEKYGVFRSSFSTEPLQMAYLEGQRNDGLKLLLDIHEHTPDRYVELLREQKDARTSSSKPGSSGTSGSGTSSGSDTRNE